MTRTATWADWRAAAGTDVRVEPDATWTLVTCTDARSEAGWTAWELAFRAPGAVGQGTVVLDLPGVGPQAVFVVPTGATPDGTDLAATFVVPEETTLDDSETED